MVGSARKILSRAVKEVKLADHLLNTVYPVAENEKLLLHTMRHAAKAAMFAEQAMAQRLPLFDETKRVAALFTEMLTRYEVAPVVFSKKAQLVIASDQFSCIQTISVEMVQNGLETIKQFVFEVGKQQILGDCS